MWCCCYSNITYYRNIIQHKYSNITASSHWSDRVMLRWMLHALQKADKQQITAWPALWKTNACRTAFTRLLFLVYVVRGRTFTVTHTKRNRRERLAACGWPCVVVHFSFCSGLRDARPRAGITHLMRGFAYNSDKSEARRGWIGDMGPDQRTAEPKWSMHLIKPPN